MNDALATTEINDANDALLAEAYRRGMRIAGTPSGWSTSSLDRIFGSRTPTKDPIP